VYLLFSTRSEFRVNQKKKRITDSFYLGFIRFGKKYEYDQLTKIRVDKDHVTLKASNKPGDEIADYVEYTARLVFDENRLLEIETSTDFESFWHEMNQLAEDLELPIEKTF
jgi:hypothetical protein